MAEETPEPQIAQKPVETAETVAEIESVEEKPAKPWLKIVLFSILGIIIATGLVFAGYKLAQIRQVQPGPQPTPTPESVSTPTPTIVVTPTPDPTADWKTYTNSKYGYQFKHPLGWIFKAEIVSDETKPLYVIRENVLSNIVDDYLVFISVWDNPDRRSLINWLQFMKDSGALPVPAEAELAANYTVAGEPAFKIWSDPISKGKEPGRCFQACPILDVYFTHRDKAYRVELNYHREVDKESQETFNLLLSTFKFLE